MLNKKVILLSGYARGGTNIAWNLLQSHPGISAPMYETGELFRRQWRLRACGWFKGGTGYCRQMIDSELFENKMHSLQHPDNRYMAEGVVYSKENLAGTALNLKSVNKDIYLTDTLLKVYPELYFIGLARNGYAYCDGYVRRGGSAADAGRMYSRIAKQMKKYSQVISRFKIVRFEDILEKPFYMASELYSFTGVQPVNLEKLRFKSKKVMGTGGQHATRFGNENSKYWFDISNIDQILNPDVNRTQINRLSETDVADFSSVAAEALEFFGYEVQ